MKFILKKATVIDENSPFHQQVVDLCIEDGIITQIAAEINEACDKEIDTGSLHVSPAWFDLKCEVGEPGFEDKEDVVSCLTAAASGGFSDIAVLPNTYPVADNKSVVEFIRKQGLGQVCNVYVAGAASVKAEGKDMSELYDMTQGGALYFTDGKKSIQNADLLKRLLLYAKQFDVLIAQFPHDQNLIRNGVINEGVVSTGLGLKGMPQLAENVLVRRDLEIVKYTGGKLHFSGISSAEALEEIIASRKAGLDVSCDINIKNIAFSDNQLEGFDTNYKLLPPLRDKKNTEKLLSLVIQNTDWIILTSDHSPQVIEDKKCEFDHAAFGSTGLQTFYSTYNEFLSDKLELSQFIRMITQNPRNRLKQKQVSILEGAEVCLNVFDPSITWTFNESTNYSKSTNSPFYNKDLRGKVIGLFNGTRYFV